MLQLYMIFSYIATFQSHATGSVDMQLSSYVLGLDHNKMGDLTADPILHGPQSLRGLPSR